MDNLELQTPPTTEANNSTTTMDNVDDFMTPWNRDDVVSPIKLKKACIQTLLQSVPHTDPMSLFKACLDVLSWNSEQYFPGAKGVKAGEKVEKGTKAGENMQRV